MASSTTALILEAVSNISHELARIENALDANEGIRAKDRHAIKGAVERMFGETDLLSEWLAAERLEDDHAIS